MLYPMKDLLDRALKEKYCIIAPSIREESCMRAAIEAAEELNSPMILNCMFPSWDYDWDKGEDEKIRFQVALAREYALRTRIPVAINRDHTPTFKGCMQAIASGVTSVMIDCSTMPFDENVRCVREVVFAAHAAGVSVEAELGHVGIANTSEMKSKPFENPDSTPNFLAASVLTEPAELKTFVAMTGADCVAVSIGNAHGPYAKNIIPHIDFKRLAALREAVPDTPLVLHGGSGTGDENIAKAARMGICKINVGTDVEAGAWKAVVDAYKTKGRVTNPFSLARKGYKAEIIRQIKLLGSENKAW